MEDFGIPPELVKSLDLIDEQKSKILAEQLKEEEESQDKIVVTEEEVSKFWDSMLKKEAYTKEFDIKGLKFVLKTRKADEIQESMRRMDDMTLQLSQTIEYFQVETILACSLHSFGEDKLESKTLDSRIIFIRSLPSPLIRILTQSLDKFDTKVLKLTEEVTSGNF